MGNYFVCLYVCMIFMSSFNFFSYFTGHFRNDAPGPGAYNIPSSFPNDQSYYQALRKRPSYRTGSTYHSILILILILIPNLQISAFN